MMFHTKPSIGEDVPDSAYIKPFDAVSTGSSQGYDGKDPIESGVMYRFKATEGESLYWPEELPFYNSFYWAEKLSEKGTENSAALIASHAEKLIEAMAGLDAPPGLAVLVPIEPVDVSQHLVIGPG